MFNDPDFNYHVDDYSKTKLLTDAEEHALRSRIEDGIELNAAILGGGLRPKGGPGVGTPKPKPGKTPRPGKGTPKSGKIDCPPPKIQQHHSDPKFMGGEPKQKKTPVPKDTHTDLHRDLNKFLRDKEDAAGNHMRPQRGNSGADIADNFTRQERLEAMAEFYKKFRDKYPDAARDFFKQHPELE